MIQKEIKKASTQLQLFPVNNKRIEASFTGEKISSDGSLLLLRDVAKQTGLLERINGCIIDQRDQRYITHTYAEMLYQRIFQISAAYEDCNDCNDFRDDSIFKICSGRLPMNGVDLASQPTMSRLENTISQSELYNIAQAFVQNFIDSYDTEPLVNIDDCDDTNNIAYGYQQLTIFNNYYHNHCYMPLHIYEGLSGKLITTILTPGRRSKQNNIAAILQRIVTKLREVW